MVTTIADEIQDGDSNHQEFDTHSDNSEEEEYEDDED